MAPRSALLRFALFGYLATSVAAGATACSPTDSRTHGAVGGDIVSSIAPAPQSAPNELGRIPVFEYHLITEKNAV
jgi:hypothetical protein